MSTAGWIVLGLIVIVVLWGVMTYNGLVSLRQRVNQAFADIDVQLKQRHDLIPNLVETVKGYATHERGTLEAVVQARNAAISAQGPAAQAAARSASCHWVPIPLTRIVSSRRPYSPDAAAAQAFSRATSLASTPTASSRSRMRASTGSVLAFSRARSLELGM